MGYNIDVKYDIIYIKCSGRLNIENSIEFENELKERFHNNIKYIIFNLREVEYISSSGIRLLVANLKNVQENDGILILSEISEQVLNVLKLVGLDDKFIYTNSDQEAIEYINERK